MGSRCSCAPSCEARGRTTERPSRGCACSAAPGPAFGRSNTVLSPTRCCPPRRLQTGHASQGRRLAATTRPEKDDELPRLDLEIEVVDRHHRRLPAESLGQAAHAYLGQSGHPPFDGERGDFAPLPCVSPRSPTYGWKRAFQRAWNAAIFAGVKFFRFGTRGGTKSCRAHRGSRRRVMLDGCLSLLRHDEVVQELRRIWVRSVLQDHPPEGSVPRLPFC